MLFLELRPPDLVELVAVPARGDAAGSPAASDADCHQMARALQGLTLDEARYALRRALCVGPAARTRSRCRRCSKRSGCWSIAAASSSSSPTAPNLGEVGGLEGLKKWLLERRKLFQMRDSLSTEIVPKGVLMMGIPGCGKSLCVKAIASSFELPLYRIDMIEIFSGRHGKPEGAFVEACRMMEDMAPGGPVVRRNRDGDHVHGIGRRAGPHLRVLPHLDAGEDARPVRRGDRQSHRPAARRDDPQGPLRRGLLRRSAARRGADRDLQNPPRPPRRGRRAASTWSR